MKEQPWAYMAQLKSARFANERGIAPSRYKRKRSRTSKKRYRQTGHGHVVSKTRIMVAC